MQFLIQPIIDGKATNLQVELIHFDENFEQYKVAGRNKSITLQTNRRIFLAKGLKHRRGQWKIVDGQMHNTYALEKIQDAIDDYLDTVS